MTNFYILKDKIPVPASVLEWGRWMETHFQERVVAQDTIGPYWISTVFIGLDHDFFGSGPSLIFETMITYENKWLDYQERYPTWELALEGHRKACDYVRREIS